MVGSAASGEMPTWFADTYHGANGRPDLERLWVKVKAMSISAKRAGVVFQLRNKFGGYCDNQKATDSAFGDGVTRNPWRDGGCVPDAPQNLTATSIGSGNLTVSWTAPDDGGSPIEGYTVQWKSGAQDYDPSRQADVTNLANLSYTISGLTAGEYTVQVLAYNTNGDGTAAVLTSGGGDRGGNSSRDSGGGSSGGGSSGSSSPPPAPTRSPIIGSTPAATAKEVAGDLLVLQRHDQPGVEVEVGVGWIGQDGQRIITIGFVRDGDLGQTYAVVRREGDGLVVRRWIAPDSHLVYAVPWAIVNTQYTFPVGVILAIPLDDQHPPPNMLTRRFDGSDDRILAYDAELGQWRHVPDEATFQARGYYWYNVTAADAAFFERISQGSPYPASTLPAQGDYPNCLTT